jgi:hypothetical protein
MQETVEPKNHESQGQQDAGYQGRNLHDAILLFAMV